MSEHVELLVAAGLYDPDDPAAVERLELFVFLLDEIGASIPELVQADEQGGLLPDSPIRVHSNVVSARRTSRCSACSD